MTSKNSMHLGDKKDTESIYFCKWAHNLVFAKLFVEVFTYPSTTFLDWPTIGAFVKNSYIRRDYNYLDNVSLD